MFRANVCNIKVANIFSYTDPIEVGYEMTVYTTAEGSTQVELCALITSPDRGAPRKFSISASTRDGTAGTMSV